MLYTAPTAYKGGSLFGVAEFVKLETGPIIVRVLDSVPFTWINFNPQVTVEYGDGFAREVGLSGGWYDKLINLYTYYGTGLAVGGVTLPALTAAVKLTDWNEAGTLKVMRTENNPFGAAEGASPNGMVLGVTPATGVGTGLSGPRADTPTRDVDTGEYDYTTDTTGDGISNTSGLTLTYTRATGLFKGSFKVWYDYVSAQDNTTDLQTLTHTSKTVSYEGALTPVRETGEAEGRGFFLWADKSSVDSGKVNSNGDPIMTPYSFIGSYDFLLLGN